MSANSAVMVLRSPSGAPRASSACCSARWRGVYAMGLMACVSTPTGAAWPLCLVGGVEAGVVVRPLSDVPHSPQDFARVRFSAPQRGQQFVRGLPHSMQNLLPSGWSDPQLEQRIPVSPYRR
jgi:hypothetical protein